MGKIAVLLYSRLLNATGIGYGATWLWYGPGQLLICFYQTSRLQQMKSCRNVFLVSRYDVFTDLKTENLSKTAEQQVKKE